MEEDVEEMDWVGNSSGHVSGSVEMVLSVFS